MKVWVKLNDKEMQALTIEAKRTKKTESQIIREGLGLYFAVKKEINKQKQKAKEEGSTNEERN